MMEMDYVLTALRELKMGNKTVEVQEVVRSDNGDEYGRFNEQIEEWSLDWDTQKNQLQEIAIKSEDPEQNFLRTKILMLVLKELLIKPFLIEKRNTDANIEKYNKVTAQELNTRIKKTKCSNRSREENEKIIEVTEELMKHQAGGMEVVTRWIKRPGKKNREELTQKEPVRLRKKKEKKRKQEKNQIEGKKFKTMTREELDEYCQSFMM